jgi:hypothetical protein
MQVDQIDQVFDAIQVLPERLEIMFCPDMPTMMCTANPLQFVITRHLRQEG